MFIQLDALGDYKQVIINSNYILAVEESWESRHPIYVVIMTSGKTYNVSRDNAIITELWKQSHAQPMTTITF